MNVVSLVSRLARYMSSLLSDPPVLSRFPDNELCICVAIKHDPEKQVLLSKVSNDVRYQPYYLQQSKELVELAEQIHSELANDLMNATMNSTFDKQVVDSQMKA